VGARYVAQARLLIPEGAPYPRSRFTRRAVSEHLAGLGVTGSTFNRHRSGILQFGRFLVEREVLDTNPVRDVRASRENPARDTIYTMGDVQRLVAALPVPYRALEALLAATGIEMQAALRLRRRELDLAQWQLHARGNKTAWRNRVVVVSEPWAMPMLAAHVRGLFPDALLFGDVQHDAALDAHHSACKALALPHSTLHDHRHHFAVAALKRGAGYAFVAHQLGHHNTMLAQQRYGRYVPNAEELHRGALAESGRSARKSRAVAHVFAQGQDQPEA
jgi:integrase